MTAPDDPIDAKDRPAAGSRVAVGFSGGLDSTVLLHALRARGEYELRAIHVHHGLQDAADAWVAHCESVCSALGMPLETIRVDVREYGAGLEAAARDARYAALGDSLASGEILAVAHHLDDQAETVLLRLLRGAGPHGLAAMRSMRPFAAGRLWRPLLGTPRRRLEDYARARGLRWIEDPQNAQDAFARSVVRHDVMPPLTARWPGAAANFARAAALSGEAAGLLDEMADEDLRVLTGDPAAPTLPVAALRALGPPRRRNLVRRWLARRGLPTPYFDTLARLDAELLDARADAEPILAWPGAELRRYRDALHAMPTLPPAPEGLALPWSGDGSLVLPAGCGTLEGRRAGPCTVRLPVPLSRYRPAGEAHTRTLKNLFQERGVPPWRRLRTPAIEREGSIVWIGGIGWTGPEAGATLEWRAPA